MPRRLKILRVSAEALADLLRLDGSKRIRISGLPADARIVRVSDLIFFERGFFAFQVESAEFPEVVTGEMLPWLNLNVEEWFDDPADAPTLVNRLGVP